MTRLYEIDPEAAERALFGSLSNYSDVSSDDFSVTYGNNSPCTELRQSQILCGFIKNSVSTGAQSPSVLTSGRLRPRPTFLSSSTVQPELSYQAQADLSEGPLTPMKVSEIYFDPVNNSDDSLVFQLDDHIKDLYCRYRDIRLSKDTLILIIIYLNDILLAAPIFEECHRNTLFVIDLLEALGFRINRGKYELIPSHRIPFLGFVVDSSNAYQPSNGKGFFNPVHGNASERQSSNCSPQNVEQIYTDVLSHSPCSFPTHYRHLQFVKNLVLRNSLNLVEAYDKEVYLNEKAREDLAWWENRLQFHYSQPINFPPPSKVITSDSCDYGWRILSNGEHSQGLWPWEEIKWQINLKELMAGFIGLKLFTKCHPCLTHIRLQMGNTTSVHYVNKIRALFLSNYVCWS